MIQRTIGLFFALAVAGCCGGGGASHNATANVNCQEHQLGFNCSIVTHGGLGKNYRVCWDINVNCADGQKLMANTCEDMAGEGSASAIVPNSKFSGGKCSVAKVTGISVTNVKMVQK